MMALSSNAFPAALKKIIVDAAIQHIPNFVVGEFQIAACLIS